MDVMGPEVISLLSRQTLSALLCTQEEDWVGGSHTSVGHRHPPALVLCLHPEFEREHVIHEGPSRVQSRTSHSGQVDPKVSLKSWTQPVIHSRQPS